MHSQEGQAQQLSWKSSLDGFRVEAIAHRLICSQVCTDSSSTKAGEGQFWVYVMTSGQRQRRSILHYTNWLSCKTPPSGKATSTGHPHEGQLRKCHNPIKTPKALPQLIPEALHPSPIHDAKWCNRFRILQDRVSNLSPFRGSTWALPSGPTCINPGTHRGVIYFYLICSCPPTTSSSISFFFSFFYC